MSNTGTLKEFIGIGEETVEVREFQCAECGNTFESAKATERAQCMECLSNHVEPTE